jgi:AraC-like DNA-binding protein
MYEYRISSLGQMYLYNVKSDNELYKGSSSHCHKEFEIYYMIEGEVEITIEGKKFFAVSDSLMLIPSNHFHQWEYPTGKIHSRISIHFLPELLSESERDFFLSKFSAPVHFLNGSLHKINSLIQSIDECKLYEEPVKKIAAKARLVSLLSQIHFIKSNNSIKPVVLDERIGQVIVYIGNHLQEELSLDILSDKFRLNKNHLNVLFHKIVGTPIMKFVTAKRLGLAQQEMLSGTPFEEAAYNAGFNEYTTFFRAYKSFYGCSPSEAMAGGMDFTYCEKGKKTGQTVSEKQPVSEVDYS